MPPSNAKQKPRMFFEIVMAHKSSTLLLRMPYILLAFTNSEPLAAKVLPNRIMHFNSMQFAHYVQMEKAPYGTFSKLA